MKFAKRAIALKGLGSFTAIIILVCFSAASFGATVTYRYEGTLNSAVGSIPAGTPFTGTFSYDSNSPERAGINDPDVGSYHLDSFELTIGAEFIRLSGFGGSTQVDNRPTFDQWTTQHLPDVTRAVGGGVEGGTFGGLDFSLNGQIDFLLVDNSATALSSDQLPGPQLTLADFPDFARLTLNDGNGSFSTGQVTAFGSVSNSGDVVVGDKAWRQLTDTQHLYYDVVVRKCDAVTGTCTGVCSAETGACDGSVGGVDFTGWTWASVTEVGELFAALTPHPGGVAQISDANTTWAPDFVSRFAPTLYFTESLSFCETRGLENRTLAVQGFTRTTVATNVNFAHSPRLWDGISSVITDLADTSHPVGKTNDFCGYGIWLYRPAETPPPSEAPTADAGIDQSVRAGTSVQLNGSGSFDDNTPTENLIFDWTFASVPLGATPTLANAGTSTPSFAASFAGTYVIELVVTDQDGQASAPDEVIISSDSNLPPTPDAGPDQLVVVGSTVELSGANSSDPENDTIIFEWLWADWPGFPAPPPPAAGLDTVSPSFVVESEGEYQLLLRVSDFLGPGNAFDLVSVIAVSTSNFAQLRIVEANDTISALPATSVTTQGNQNALGNFLSQAITAIQEGEIAEAVDKLSKAIARTDGCVLRGVPDGNGSGRDWITSCDDQAVLYDSLTAALQALLGQ